MKTTSYEISKKLKEAGFDAEGDFSYRVPDSLNDLKAYSLETILDALPKINKQEYFLCSGGVGYLNDDCIAVGKEKNESLADTAGKLWLMLKDKGMV